MIEIDLALLLAQLVTFLIAVFILWQTVWKSLTGLLTKRREKIEEDLSLIKHSQDNVRHVEEEYQALLEVVQSEAEHIMQERKQQAQKEYERIIREAEDDAEEIRHNAHLQVKRERRQAAEETAREIAMLSLKLTERFLRQSVDVQCQERLLKEAREKIQMLQGTRGEN